MRAPGIALAAFVLVIFASAALRVTSSAAVPSSPRQQTRLAFVVGNESYANGALPTAANDAGLIAETLQAAGFTVVGARDLDAETLRQAYAEFLHRVAAAGPQTVALLYLSGYGLQYGTDTYYVPIGADVSRDVDIPIAAIRLSDLAGPLDALKLDARFMIFDIAYKLPFHIDGGPLAAGLAAVDAGPGTLVAYNAAPGTVAAPGKGNYGLYAQSLAAMLREPEVPPDVIFDRVRLRVNQLSLGAEVPWDTSKVDPAFRFFVRGAGAPQPGAAPPAAWLSQPIKDLPVDRAYTAAVARDNFGAYADFGVAHGGVPLARRVHVLLAVRREALTWRKTIDAGTPAAYWSYLSRYAQGPHAATARARLETLSAALSPPPGFVAIPDDVPPPLADEIPLLEQPSGDLDDPSLDLPPPPAVPDDWLPPIDAAFLDLPAPAPPGGFVLPVPAFSALPDDVAPPGFVTVPGGTVFYAGIGRDRDVVLTNPRVVSNIHHSFPTVAAQVGGDGRGVPLPEAALQRAMASGRPGSPARGPGPQAPMEQRLPGLGGKPLPPAGAAADHRGESKSERVARPARTMPHLVPAKAPPRGVAVGPSRSRTTAVRTFAARPDHRARSQRRDRPSRGQAAPRGRAGLSPARPARNGQGAQGRGRNVNARPSPPRSGPAAVVRRMPGGPRPGGFGAGPRPAGIGGGRR